jgi:hypothetical protein
MGILAHQPNFPVHHHNKLLINGGNNALYVTHYTRF